MNLHKLAAEKALNQRHKGKKISPERALLNLKAMGFFRKPMAIYVSRALREYGR